MYRNTLGLRKIDVRWITTHKREIHCKRFKCSFMFHFLSIDQQKLILAKRIWINYRKKIKFLLHVIYLLIYLFLSISYAKEFFFVLYKSLTKNCRVNFSNCLYLLQNSQVFLSFLCWLTLRINSYLLNYVKLYE